MTNDIPLIRWISMFENTSKSGQQYFVGYANGLKLVLLRNKNAGENEPGWNLCVTARPERKPQEADPAEAKPYPQHRSAKPRDERPRVHPDFDDEIGF
jgi:hypothetical protein